VPKDKNLEGNNAAGPGGGENASEEEALQPVEEGEPASNEARLAAELKEARAEAEKNWDLYLRERAERENFRKRMQREKEDLARFANENLLRELLPIFDNLERAVSHSAEGQEGGAGLLEGVSLTLDQFQKVLEKFGVVPVEAVGQPFDPAWHEAMGQVESDEHPPNTVAQEMQKGYILNDRLLRPALVLVAKAPSREQP
jgi:molecular chaperone GrpE